MTSRVGAGWQSAIASRFATEQSSMLWLLLGLAACLAGQLFFHLRLSVFDGVVLYAAGAVAIWRSQRAHPAPLGTLALAPALVAAAFGRRARFLAGSATLAALLATIAILAPQLRPVPVQLLVLAAALLWIWAGHAADGRRLPRPSLLGLTISGRHRLGLVALVAAAVGARTWDLGALPEGLWYDEARIGSEAWRILTDASFRPVYSEGTTTPAAYIYMVSWMEALFGKTVFAIRMASAVPGAVSTLLVYLVARLAFGYRVGLIAAGFFALARWDINFSRIAMQGATTPMLTLMVAAAGLGALRTGRLSLYALLGVSLGALLWFYTSNVFMLVVVLAPLAMLVVGQRATLWQHRRGLAMAVAGALLIAAPVAVSTLTSPTEILNRPQQASVFSSTPPEALLGTIWDSAVKHLGMLHVAGDRNGRHNLPGAPMLDAVTAIFMALGVVVAALRWRDPRFVLLLVWVPLMLLPGVLSVAFEAPQALRGIGAVVPAALLAGVGLAAATSRLRPETGNLVAVVLVLVAGASNLSTYFGLQRQDARVWEDFSIGATTVARTVLAAPERERVYASVHYAAHPSVEFLTGGAATRLEPEAQLPLRDGRGGAFVFASEEPVYYAMANAYYPDAGCQPLTRQGQPPAAYTCTVTNEMVAATRGLPVTATAVDGSTATAQPIVANGGVILLPPTPTVWQVTAVGSLLALKSGTYRFRLEASEELRLHINGRPVATGGGEGTLALAQGLHLIELNGRAGGGELRVLWAEPDKPLLAPIPQEAVYRGTIRPMGLSVDYRKGEAYTDTPAVRRIEPSPYVYYHVPPLERPFTAEWTGSLVAPVAGAYRFRLGAVSEAEVEVDGVRAVRVGPDAHPEAVLQLTEGVHRVRIRHLVAGGYSHLYLQWRPPGRQAFEHIPPERLRPW